MKTALYAGVALVALSALGATSAFARDQIQVAGSSTVLPYAKIVAEAFGETYPDFKTPVVESGGSGAGIKQFCEGVGEDKIDIANASRAMKADELATCKTNGVADVEEVKIGYDGIVFATDINGPDFAIQPADIYKALAAKVVVDGKLVDNPYSKWSEVNPAFPEWDIAAYIPGEKHGTREVFEEKLMTAGCDKDGLKAAGVADADVAKTCIAIRKDGKAVDIDGDYTETLARIDSNKTGMGVFGLAFYENNADKLKVATVGGITPSTETIADGTYPVSRPLFFYVKKAHLGVIPGLKEYVEFFLSDEMTGPDSPLAQYGLVAAPDAERQAQRDKFAAGTTM
ncbi:phosphate ABC transporter substrate-binding protein [Youhaiella tibetensis]|uniref:Phosphonate ABC transporter substrate-binding protein n=1 Tax=Paradevosia tibetensis TaxID=1447062 RepID=A0A5B9DJQ0_9HYPH|nr:substrate-binding domain-containing protein [Youhaiella tibetensis]AKR58482.1 Phosphate ABC transporter, periplasmic phosphate-binding protein PstS [Devosia sp. H5989]QEE19347.1 phosphonate ABC transporter substrate-binding protein [Youhaiella tibetensis]GGF34030.1 phosphate ABC transporter substrate-binding protein [Youhaiella tibetensis]